MVFYRKYRPQTIADLDSTSVREKLTAVLRDPQKVPHAFLFTGPKGLGKTSTARIIAKIVNCTGKKTKRGTSGIEPCNECDQCISITNGTNMDILEIDAASNRGIDEIRELKETIKLAPLNSHVKVYIIDEVHMLTTEAFNALLKTLEEPPAHAMFLLATTEPQKVPPTILSRTFHIQFQKATEEELIRSFERIVRSEKLSITPEALQKIAAFSDGGFRDGAKILEEVAALGEGKKITSELIEEKYRISAAVVQLDAFINSLASRQTKTSLEIIAKISEEGSDFKYFLEEVIQRIHTDLLKSAGVSRDGNLESETKLTTMDLQILVAYLTQALFEMRSSYLPQLPLEIAVIEWGRVDGTAGIEMNSGKAQQSHPEKPYEKRLSVDVLRKEAGNIRKIQAMYGEKEEKKKPSASVPANVSVLHYTANGEITTEWLEEFWNAIIHAMKRHNHTLAGVLRGCMIKSFDRKQLVIETAYSFHRERLDNGKTKETIEAICKELTGKPVTVTVELKTN